MKNNIVAQNNNLINAKYKLSINEKRILLCVISKINPKQKIEGTLEIELNIKDIIDIFDCNKENYTYFIDLARNLRKKDFPIPSLEDGTLITVGWINKAKLDRAGVLKITLDEDIIPYLVELQEYTKYKLENVVKFKNVHTFRIYELCKQYEKFKNRKIGVAELKEMLDLQDKYKKFPDFKKRVLESVKKEINTHSDILIDYELIKEGRAYKNIKFTIESKKTVALDEVKKEKVEIKVIDTVTQANIITLKTVFNIDQLTDADILAILNTAKGDVGKVIHKYYLVKDTPDIANFTGLMIKAIKKDYSEVAVTQEVKANVKTKFHNFDQRTSGYTPEELEKILDEKQKKRYK